MITIVARMDTQNEGTARLLIKQLTDAGELTLKQKEQLLRADEKDELTWTCRFRIAKKEKKKPEVPKEQIDMFPS